MLLVTVIIISAMLHTAYCQVVPCTHQQEACVCDESNVQCIFQLEIEELQTFTSYRITEDEEIITRGTPGDTYFLDQSGYNPSLDSNICDGIDEPPECGICSAIKFNNGMPIPVAEEETFRRGGCSIPVTVDGRTYRFYIAVNGRIPGPTLVVTEGQEIIVNVINKLTSEGITIHWHGMHQRGTPWMDGVASISHIPIVPGGTFQYKFNATPAGTHWYHSHLGAQRTDGLFGGLIVREHESRREDIQAALNLGPIEDMPSLHTLSLLDWQRESSLNLFVQIHSTLGFYPRKPLGDVPQNAALYNRTASVDGIEVGPVPFFSGLINGRGRYDASTYSILSVFNVTTDRYYRFRLIGAQSLYAFRFEIDGHRLQVIASDGHFIKPITVDYIIIHSGERYDFVPIPYNNLIVPNNFIIRAKTLENNISDTRNHNAEAILHYEGASILNVATFYNNVYNPPSTSHCTSVKMCKALNCPFKDYPKNEYIKCIHLNELSSLFPPDETELPKLDVDGDQLLFFNFGFEGQSSTSAINGVNFLPPASPYQTYSGQYDADVNNPLRNTCEECNPNISPKEQAIKCTCIKVREILPNAKVNEAGNKSIVMVFSAVGDRQARNRDFAHPIHLHGHSFFIVHVGHGKYDQGGRLTENSPDVACDNGLCMQPFWQNKTAPEFQLQNTDLQVNESAIQKDTVILPAGGYVVVAFLADNPGYWFLHCHIEVHQLEGMAVVIKEYPESEQPTAPKGINKVGEFPNRDTTNTPNRGTTDAPLIIQIVLSLSFVLGLIVS